MILYADTSAVLSWLLGEPEGRSVEVALVSATSVVASALTVAECERALVRATATSRISSEEEKAYRSLLATAVMSWTIRPIASRHLNRSGRSFPNEPIRTLDALHLATAEEFAGELGNLIVLSLDDRVRKNALGMGMEVLP